MGWCGGECGMGGLGVGVGNKLRFGWDGGQRYSF